MSTKLSESELAEIRDAGSMSNTVRALLDHCTALEEELAAPEQQSPRVCVRCNHNNVDREGVCKQEIFHPKHLFGKYPKRYCGCKCVFPESEKE